MTYDGDDDRVERAFHGIYFRATKAEARRVAAAVIASPEWAHWAWRDDLIKSHGAGHYHAKLVAVTMREVEAMEAER